MAAVIYKRLNVAVLVSGSGTNLQALIDAEKAKKMKNGKVVLVVSNKKDAYALKRARDEKIEAIELVKLPGESNERYEAKLLKILHERCIHVIVLAGYLRILSWDFVDRYENRIINIHPSLIPDFCGEGFYGLKVHEAVLKSGKKTTGATVHFVNGVVDGGKIIAQKTVEVRDDDTPESLQKRVMEEAEWLILPEAVEKVCREIREAKRSIET